MTLAERIRARRESAGLGRIEAAEAAGINATEWSKIESGKRDNPTLKRLRAIADVLGCTVGDLVDQATSGNAPDATLQSISADRRKRLQGRHSGLRPKDLRQAWVEKTGAEGPRKVKAGTQPL